METHTHKRGPSLDTVARYTKVISEFRDYTRSEAHTSAELYDFFKKYHINTAIVAQLKQQHMKSSYGEDGQMRFIWNSMFVSDKEVAISLLKDYNARNTKIRRERAKEQQTILEGHIKPVIWPEATTAQLSITPVYSPHEAIARQAEEQALELDKRAESQREQIAQLQAEYEKTCRLRDELLATANHVRNMNTSLTPSVSATINH